MCLLKKDSWNVSCTGGWPWWRECCGGSRAISVQPWLIFVTCRSPPLDLGSLQLCAEGWDQSRIFKTPLSLSPRKSGPGPVEACVRGLIPRPPPAPCRARRVGAAGTMRNHCLLMPQSPRLRCVGAESLSGYLTFFCFRFRNLPGLPHRAHRSPSGLSCLIFLR